MPRKNNRTLPRVLGSRNLRAALAKPKADGPVSGVRRNRRKGSLHASTYEDNIIKDLEDRGVAYEYEPRSFKYTRPVHRGRCTVCESKSVVVERSYTPDIRLLLSDTWIEAKGKFTPENRGKMEDFLRGNPEIDLRFLFQRDNWITKNHKSKYSDWCKKLGVKYAIGIRVPDEWVEVPEVR